MVSIIEIPQDLLVGQMSSWGIGRRHLTSSQTWTQYTQVSGPIDERWTVSIALPPLVEREDVDRFEAIFDAGDGLAGFFTAFDVIHAFPRGTGSGLGGPGVGFSDGSTFSDGTKFESGATWCQVATAGARGDRYLSLAGLVASQTLGFARGDMLAVTQGGENYGFLHKVLADVATNASGECSVRVVPRLRHAIAAGQMVRLKQPRGVFRLMDEDSVMVERGGGGIAEPSLSMIEVPEALLCDL